MSQQPPGQRPEGPPWNPPSGGQPPQGYYLPPSQSPQYGQPPYNVPPGQQPYPPQYPPQQYIPPRQPYYPPQGPPKKGLPAIAIIGIVIGSLFGLLLVIGIMGAAAGGGKSVTATPQRNVAAAPIGSPSPAAKSAATPISSVGQAVSLKNWDITVVAVEQPGQTLKTSKSGNTKTAIGQWIVIAVDLKNTGKENFGFNDPDFVLKDANGASIKVKNDFGFESDYNSYRGGLDYNTQVPPGSTVHAFIAFDVGPDATGMRLEFQGNKQLIGLGL